MTLKKQQQQWIASLHLPLATKRLLHCLNGRIYVGLKIDFFKVRYAPLHQPKPVTRLSSITIDVPASQQTPQRSLSTTTRQSVVYTLMRVDLSCRCVGPMCCVASVGTPLCSSCYVLSFFLLCCITFCNFLWLYCLVFIPICLVFRRFVCGVDLFSFLFWFLFGNLFSTISLNLNLHGFLGSLFRFSFGVFVLLMSVPITSISHDKSFLRLHSHLSFPFTISFLFFEINPVGVLTSLFLLCYLCNLFILFE